MLKGLRIILFLFVLPFLCASQDHPYLDRFQATEVDGKVFLSWTLKAGNTCNGVQILRATYGQSFQLIGEIPGVCGSVSEDVDYTFFDSSPVPLAINHYRLELGNDGFSQIVSIQINGLPSVGYQVRPHPVSAISLLLFENDTRQLHSLLLSNLHGQVIIRSETVEDHFIIDRQDFSAGIYLFALLDSDKRVVNSGKIVVGP